MSTVDDLNRRIRELENREQRRSDRVRGTAKSISDIDVELTDFQAAVLRNFRRIEQQNVGQTHLLERRIPLIVATIGLITALLEHFWR